MPGIDRGGVVADQRAKSTLPMPASPQYNPRQERMVCRQRPHRRRHRLRSPRRLNRSRRPTPPRRSSSNSRAPSASRTAARCRSRSSTARCQRSGSRSMQADTAARNPLAAIRLTNDGESGLPPGIITLYERDKAGDGRLCRRCAALGFPDGRDAPAGLCARREDRDRTRRGADRPARHRHHRPGCATAVAHRAPDHDLSRAWSGQGAASAHGGAAPPAGLDPDQAGRRRASS